MMTEVLNHYIGELNNDILAMTDEIKMLKNNISIQTNDNRPLDASSSVVRMGIVLGVRKRTEEIMGRLKQIVQISR